MHVEIKYQVTEIERLEIYANKTKKQSLSGMIANELRKNFASTICENECDQRIVSIDIPENLRQDLICRAKFYNITPTAYIRRFILDPLLLPVPKPSQILSPSTFKPIERR